jgi:hypothetical protein
LSTCIILNIGLLEFEVKVFLIMSELENNRRYHTLAESEL